MAIPIQSQAYNPITGVFGIGQMQMFSASGTWNVPQGVGKVRVRMWGAGGNNCQDASYYGGGGGGGFALKTIYDLTGVTSVAVMVGAGAAIVSVSPSAAGLTAGSSSFGSYCSATGGTYAARGTSANIGGNGIGGDINNTGGRGGYGAGSAAGGGGGSASLIGNGASATTNTPEASSGGAGAGYGSNNNNQPGSGGFMTSGGVANVTSIATLPQASVQPFSIDFIGTGGGGGIFQNGVNGGGGGFSANGGFPAGGNSYGTSSTSSSGLVIVEW